MANITVTQLTALTSVASNDEIPIWDVSAAQLKKVARSDLVGATLTGGGTIATGGFTLTVPASGTAALRDANNTFTGTNSFGTGASGGRVAVKSQSASEVPLVIDTAASPTADITVFQKNGVNSWRLNANEVVVHKYFYRYAAQYTTAITPSSNVTVATFAMPTNTEIVGRLLVAIKQQAEGGSTQRGSFRIYYMHADVFASAIQNLTLSTAEYSQNTNSQSPTVTLVDSGTSILVKVQNNAATKNIEAVTVVLEIVAA